MATATAAVAETRTALEIGQAETRTALEISQAQVEAEYLRRTLARDERRQELTNTALAVAPYILGGLAAGMLTYGIIVAAIRYARNYQIIQRDQRGDAPLVADHHGNIYDADRAPAAAIRLGKNGATAAQLGPAEQVAAAVRRDQFVDLHTRGLPGQPPRQISRQAVNGLMKQPQQPQFIIYGPDDVPPQVRQDPDILPVLDAQWREELA